MMLKEVKIILAIVLFVQQLFQSASNSSFLKDCCGLYDEKLYRCIQRNAIPLLHSEPSNSDVGASRSISMVSYATPNILSYAAYAFAINSAFASYHHYNIRTYSPSTGSEYEPRDQRWNRVKILSTILDPSSGSHRNSSHVVWFDADLVFISWTLKFEDIIASYPDHDIIISAERHAETGVANTGCFIVRNSAWSRTFLASWWSNFDRSLSHDQIFFDRLYRSLSSVEKQHIAIILPTALNSAPPAALYQTPADPVLHLMGELDGLRESAFRRGWETVCDSLNGPTPDSPTDPVQNSIESMPAQLGLSQPVLLNMSHTAWLDRLHTAFSTVMDISSRRMISPRFETPFPLPLQELSALRESMLQLKKLGYIWTNSPEITPRIVLGESFQYLLRFVQHGGCEGEEMDRPKDYHFYCDQLSGNDQVQLLNFCGLIGQDLAQTLMAAETGYHSSAFFVTGDAINATSPWATGSPMTAHAVYLQVGSCLQHLESSVHSSSRVVVQEMRSIHLSSLGSYELTKGMSRADAIGKLRLAVEIIASNAQSNPHHIISAKRALAHALCSPGGSPSDRLQGVGMHQAAIALLEDLLVPSVQWHSDHIDLAEQLVWAALCDVSSSGDMDAKYEVGSAVSTEQHAPPDPASTYHHAVESDNRAVFWYHRAMEIINQHPEGPTLARQLGSSLSGLERVLGSGGTRRTQTAAAAMASGAARGTKVFRRKKKKQKV